MTDRPSSLQQREIQRVPLQDRAFLLGKMLGVNASRVKRASLRQRLQQVGYQVHDTPHFLVGRKTGTPTMVAHWFVPEALDAELGRYFIEELKPLGLLTTAQDFAEVFGAVVHSVAPHDPQRAWHVFATNTLQRYHALLDGNHNTAANCNSPVEVFAALYRRVGELYVGESLLRADKSAVGTMNRPLGGCAARREYPDFLFKVHYPTNCVLRPGELMALITVIALSAASRLASGSWLCAWAKASGMSMVV